MAETTWIRFRDGLPRHPGRRIPSFRRVLLLYLPSAAAVLVVLLPLVYLIVRALEVEGDWVASLLRPAGLRVLGNSLALAAAVTAACLALALTLAWLTVRTDLPGRRTWAVLTSLPLVIPSYVGAYLLISALGPRGLLQGGLEALFAIERLPSIYGFWGAFLAITLLSYPYAMLPVRSALRRMDPALEEAARGLGLSGWSVFRRVTLPLLRPALGAGALLVALYALRDFGAVSVMRYTTFTRAIYLQYQSFDRGTAALYALLLAGLTILVLGMEGRARQSERRYAAEGRGSGASTPLGRWRWPAVIFCGAVVGLSLVLPAGVLAYWLLRAIQEAPAVPAILTATRNSLTVSLGAALLTVVMATPIAVLAGRDPGRWSRWAEGVSHLGFAMPGIVVALALVFFGIRAARPLYQTLPMLLLAYLILFLPLAVGPLRSSLLQVPRALEEAARSLGHGPLAAFRRVTLPLVRPGLMAGAALAFLTAMKELPATLILAPYGFNTLATDVWSAVSEAFFARAAGPALLLILASSLPTAYFVIREDRS